MKALYIASLKYSPGLFKEMNCLADCFAENEFQVTRILDAKYQNLARVKDKSSNGYDFIFGHRTLINSILGLIRVRPSVLIFYNSHPLNLFFLLTTYFFSSSTRRAVVIHEPCKKYAFKFYGLHGFKVLAITIFNKIQSWLCTDLITLSPYGEELLCESWGYNKTARMHCARILLPPRSSSSALDDGQTDAGGRKYFTFVGHVNKTKGADWFFDLVNFSQFRGEKYEFLMVTSSELRVPSDISGVSNSVLKIINPSFLSDEQISSALLQSKAVFCLHEGVTQSGVFVECMRHSVPVIALDRVGFTQFIQDCGVVVSGSKDLDELLASVRQIKEAGHLMAEACTLVYEQNFHLKHFKRFYGGFL